MSAKLDEAQEVARGLQTKASVPEAMCTNYGLISAVYNRYGLSQTLACRLVESELC